MKTLVFLFLFLPFAAIAQNENPDSVRIKQDMYRYSLSKFIKQEGEMGKLSKPLMKGKNRTIYVLNEYYFMGMPDVIGGYTIKYVDPDADREMLRKEQKKNNAPVLYISRITNHLDFYGLHIMPVTITDSEPEFSEKHVYVLFEYMMNIHKFEMRGTMYKENWKEE